jgi:hypothetical protein
MNCPQTPLSPRRRSLVPILLAILGLQVCLALGMLAGPLLARTDLTRGAVELDAQIEARVASWRTAAAGPRHDPGLGMEMPAVTLAVSDGSRTSLFEGDRWTALVFVDAGST